MPEFVDLPFETEPVEPDALCLPNARRFAHAVQEPAFVDLYQARKATRSAEDQEIVVFEVDVERPQQVYHPVKHRERLAAIFGSDQDSMPEVLALRADFPLVPHLNLRSYEKPRSLCLYDQDPRDVMLHWTPLAFVQRIRHWLALTARGKLHAQDQPLEPLLQPALGSIILTRKVFDRLFDTNEHLPIVARRLTEDKASEMIAHAEVATDAEQDNPEFVALRFMCRTVTHGIIKRQPATLQELCALVQDFGLDLLAELRSSLQSLAHKSLSETFADAKPIIILGLPKARNKAAEPEDVELWAFMLPSTLAQTGIELDVWEITNGQIGTLLWVDHIRHGENVAVCPLKVLQSFTRAQAATLSASQADEREMVLIGAGALGAEVMDNLLRAGIGRWSIIDPDRLLPHNLARHTLGGHFLGQNKAEMLCFLANELIDGETSCTCIPADVLCPGEYAEQLESALNQAEAIIDASASVSLARHLALDIQADAPRASMFFTPSGNACVVLAEDAHRQVPLDILEMQYYRIVGHLEELKGHFEVQGQGFRYSQSCRDLTSKVPQDTVSLHASLCANALKQIFAGDESFAGVWTLTSPHHTVSFTPIPPSQLVEITHHTWRIRTDTWFMAKLADLRSQKLPNETGGVVIGSHDMKRGIIYLVDTLPSPADSTEWPTVYIRGKNGLSSALHDLETKTLGNLTYVGEWHSHPEQVPASPSPEDREAFDWLEREMQATGLPPVMVIVGDNDTQVFVESMQMGHC